MIDDGSPSLTELPSIGCASGGRSMGAHGSQFLMALALVLHFMEEHLFIRGQVGGKDIDSSRVADFQTRREAGDLVLKDRLAYALSAAIDRDYLRYESPDTFDLPENCMLWQWMNVYLKAIQCADFESWAAQRQLDLKSLRVRAGSLYVNVLDGAREIATVMTLGDNSGWREVAGPINSAAQIIDPAGLEPDGLGDPSRGYIPVFSLRTALAFYGYPLPANRPQAQVMVDELRRLPGFPVVDVSGHISTAVAVEQEEQIKDCATLVAELQNILLAQAQGQEEYDFLEAYRRRVKLNSGSMLAQTMNTALSVLQRVSTRLNLGVVAPVKYSYSTSSHTLVVMDQYAIMYHVAAERLSTPEVAPVFQALEALAKKLGTDVYTDGSFSLAALLSLYGWNVPGDRSELQSLIQKIGRVTRAPLPFVHASACSVQALLDHRRYIGLLNNRFWMAAKLESLSHDKPDGTPVSSVDVNISLDPDSPLAELTNLGRSELLVVMALNEFQAISTNNQLDPEGHTLVSSSGYVGARKLGGGWVDLEAAVNSNPVLAERFKVLSQFAKRLGGSLRSNGDVTLDQALTFYSLGRPATAKAARDLAYELRAVPLRPDPAEEYWNALGGTFASVSSPLLSRHLQWIAEPDNFMPRIGVSLRYWESLKRREVTNILSAAQRQQVQTLAQQFMTGRNVSLFEYLANTVIGGKTREVVRAEADWLISQMLARPEAQAIADVMGANVAWDSAQARVVPTRACRHSLVLATIILSLDALAGQSRNHIAGINLADQQFWGASQETVRLGIERRLEVNHTLAPNMAALAAHLLLSGVAPDCLVRDVPEWVAYMSSQLWVHFKQRVAYLESKYPGVSRRLTFDSIIGGERSSGPKSQQWALKMFTGPVIDWASVNGLLPPNLEVFTAAQFKTALEAFTGQNEVLKSTIDTFNRPPVSRRALALADLRRVFPDEQALEAKVLARVSSEPSEPKASLVDLHLCGQLVGHWQQWYSTLDSLNYQEITPHLRLLSDINSTYAAEYTVQVNSLWAAYRDALVCSFSTLRLAQRQRLEYAELRLYSLSQYRGDELIAGCFGMLVLCRHPAFADCVYEVFAGQLKIVERFDFVASRLIEFAERIDVPGLPAGARSALELPVDWAAYSAGQPVRPGMFSTVVVEQVAFFAPDASQAYVFADAVGVPASMVSHRIATLAASIITNSLFVREMTWSLTASNSLTVADAISGRDAWHDHYKGIRCRQVFTV